MSLLFVREDQEKWSSGSPCHIADMTFYVARLGTKEAAKQISDIRDNLYGQFPNPKEISDDEIFSHWLSEYGVIDWENVIDVESSKEINYNKPYARNLFGNKEYWLSLNKALINHALNFENFLHDEALGDVQELKKH